MQSSFFAHFMCFEVPALVPPGAPSSASKNGLTGDDTNDDDLSLMDLDGNDIKPSNHLLLLKYQYYSPTFS